MFTTVFTNETPQTPVPKEGELYKEVTIQNVSFKLLYGYYEDFERNSKFNEPIPIYPDFINQPVFTDDGHPFVTAMQDICEHYSGKSGEDSCSECLHFCECEELFGLCYNPKKRRELSVQNLNSE